MGVVVYILCALTSSACGVMLLRGYHRSRSRLLFWSTVCFWGLALNNILLFFDLVVTGPTLDLSVIRGIVGLSSLMALVYGLVWDIA